MTPPPLNPNPISPLPPPSSQVRHNDAIRGDTRALVDITDPRCPNLHATFFMVDQLIGKMTPSPPPATPPPPPLYGRPTHR